MEKHNNLPEHLYSRDQLKRCIKKFNEILKYLKVTWKFDLDDEIVDIKRGIVNENNSVYRDYLDFIHTPVKEYLFDNKIDCDRNFRLWMITNWIHCIKFILKNGKELVIAETQNDNLPEWIHWWWEYANDLKKIKTDWGISYYEIVLNILWEIWVKEHKFFHSPEYLNNLKTVDIAQALTIIQDSDSK